MNQNQDFNSLSLLDKRIYLEDAIDGLIKEIEDEGQLPTKWEVDHIKVALDYILAGMYNASAQSIYYYKIDPKSLANPEPCFTPDTDTSVRALSDYLYYVKGATLRRDS